MKTVYEKGDVIKDEKSGNLGIVVNDVFVLIIQESDCELPSFVTESYPENMVPVSEKEISRLRWEIQIEIKAIRATLFFVR